ncbi:hypothetical protein [Treponema sp.]|uniref:hypothetical protein n=1 Tax=Treponema sp. TaxID=166 RepID=UPI003F0E713D
MQFFYSNCLFEAVRAKIKDWKNIKIMFIPKKYNDSGSFHFMWANVKTDESFDFKAETNVTNPFKKVLFKGYIPRKSI